MGLGFRVDFGNQWFSISNTMNAEAKAAQASKPWKAIGSTWYFFRKTVGKRYVMTLFGGLGARRIRKGYYVPES